MKLSISTKNNPEAVVVDLAELYQQYSGVVTIGQKTKKVWHAVAIEDESLDVFQCHLLGAGADSWKLNHGQNRTECPKGLLSPRLIPCNGCTGRCVNVRAGRPKYIRHNPEVPTLINGEPVSEWGTEIKVGDVISLGEVRALVIDNR